MTRRLTFRDILRRHADPEDDVYVRLSVYPLAIPVTWGLVSMTNISANQVTIAGLLAGMAASLSSVAADDLVYLLIGYAAYFVLDFVDGQVASFRGGTAFGAVLDFVTDRTVFLMAIGALAIHHFRHEFRYGLLLLNFYLVGYVYLDALALARRRVRETRLAAASNTPGKPRGIGGFSVWSLFPTRLSSPVFFAATWALGGSAELAYYAAIFAVFGEYAKLATREAWRWGHARGQSD